MKKLLLSTLILFLALATKAQTVYEWSEDGRVTIRLKPDQPAPKHNEDGIVALEDLPFLKTISREYGFSAALKPIIKLYTPEFDRTFIVDFDKMEEVDALIRDLQQLPQVEFAERVPVVITLATPNDRFWHQDSSWQLFKVNAQAAWEIQPQGDKNVVIAITDNAINIKHDDLVGNLWQNMAEVNGQAGVDDDGNGYIDDKHGFDMSGNDPDPSPPDLTDRDWVHGIHVAGLAGAVTDNGIGMASLSRNVSVMCVKGSNDWDKKYKFENTIKMVEYAIINKADILNMSWGASQYTTPMNDIINIAHSKGIFLCAGAGNFHNEQKFYPAALDPVMAVGNTDANDKKYTWTQNGQTGGSTYGTWIDICAPAQACISLGASGYVGGKLRHGYDIIGGTSMASPQVAALAALMLSHDNTLTADQLKSTIKATAKNIDALNPTYAGKLGAGRIDAAAAMKAIQKVNTSIEKEEDKEIRIYPNPASNLFLIENVEGMQVKIYSITGEIVHQFQANTGISNVDLTDFNSGIYFIRIPEAGIAERLVVTK